MKKPKAKRKPDLNGKNGEWRVLLDRLKASIHVAEGCAYVGVAGDDQICHCAKGLQRDVEAVLEKLHLSSEGRKT